MVTLSHPVQLQVAPAPRSRRVHVVIRVALLLALGAIGFSAMYWVLYLALPALAALFILRKGGERYLTEDGPRIVHGLRWFAAACGYLWLLTDALPAGDAWPVDLRVEVGGTPTAASALRRLIFSLPALLLVALLSLAAAVLWLVGAVLVLVRERAPSIVTDVLAATLRYQLRLIAYHLSLVDRYPSLDQAELAHA